MNHFLSLTLLALCIALVFTAITKEKTEERVKYFLTMMAWMVLGSLVFSWLMYFFP